MDWYLEVGIFQEYHSLSWWIPELMTLGTTCCNISILDSWPPPECLYLASCHILRNLNLKTKSCKKERFYQKIHKTMWRILLFNNGTEYRTGWNRSCLLFLLDTFFFFMWGLAFVSASPFKTQTRGNHTSKMTEKNQLKNKDNMILKITKW